MRSMIGLRLILAASLVLGTAGAASAQLKLGGYNLTGEIEAGGRYVDAGSERRRGKFEEYRDFDSNVFLEDLHLRLFRDDERYFTEFGGSKWGLETQEYSLRAGRLGLWEFGFDWDQMRHIYSTTGRFGFTEVRRGVLTLPTPRQSLASFNSAPELDEISVRWDTAKIGFKVTPTPDLELSALYTRIHKDGDRPIDMHFSTSPGGNTAEVLEPIEHTIHDLRLQASWARENWQLQGGYTLSVFENELRSLTADNPCFGLPGSVFAGQCGTDGGAAASGSGRLALPPSNMAHTFTLSGGVNLPMRTRLSANISYSLRLQNDTFIPHTIAATSVPDPELTLPQKSLNGNVQTFLVNLNATSRPLRALTLGAKYRLFYLEDVSDRIVFTNTFIDDRGKSGGHIAERFSHSRHNLDLDARYQILAPLATTFGVGWERIDRPDHRDVAETDEFFGKVAVDYEPFDWLLARLTYRPSFLVNDGYRAHEETPPFRPFPMRRFDVNERDRQRVDGMLQFMPIETFTTTLTGSYRYDDYLNVVSGVQNETSWSTGLDFGWMPMERLSFGGGYVYERINLQQRDRPQLLQPDYDWVARNIDTVHTVHANVTTTLIPRRLDFVVGGNASTALGRVLTDNPVPPASGTAANNEAARAKPWPAFEDTLIRLDAKLLYHFLKQWTATLGYAFESFEKHDFRTDRLTPWIEGAGQHTTWLGVDTKNYTAHILALTLRYRFE
jgi:MtrB/PioB family decaheme-associated outer membrane protein